MFPYGYPTSYPPVCVSNSSSSSSVASSSVVYSSLYCFNNYITSAFIKSSSSNLDELNGNKANKAANLDDIHIQTVIHTSSEHCRITTLSTSICRGINSDVMRIKYKLHSQSLKTTHYYDNNNTHNTHNNNDKDIFEHTYNIEYPSEYLNTSKEIVGCRVQYLGRDKGIIVGLLWKDNEEKEGVEEDEEGMDEKVEEKEKKEKKKVRERGDCEDNNQQHKQSTQHSCNKHFLCSKRLNSNPSPSRLPSPSLPTPQN